MLTASKQLQSQRINRAYFNVKTHEILVSERKPKPCHEWRVLPSTMGVRWHDDQSCNQILFSSSGDYAFEPACDTDLALEYIDQIAEHFS
jgi:hypothetical protein